MYVKDVRTAGLGSHHQRLLALLVTSAKATLPDASPQSTAIDGVRGLPAPLGSNHLLWNRWNYRFCINGLPASQLKVKNWTIHFSISRFHFLLLKCFRDGLNFLNLSFNCLYQLVRSLVSAQWLLMLGRWGEENQPDIEVGRNFVWNCCLPISAFHQWVKVVSLLSLVWRLLLMDDRTTNVWSGYFFKSWSDHRLTAGALVLVGGGGE